MTGTSPADWHDLGQATTAEGEPSSITEVIWDGSTLAGINRQFKALSQTIDSLFSGVAAADVFSGLSGLAEVARRALPTLPSGGADLGGSTVDLKNLRPANYEGMFLGDQARLVQTSIEHTFGSFETLPPHTIQALLSLEPPTSSMVDALFLEHHVTIAQHCAEGNAERSRAGAAATREHSTLLVKASAALLDGHDAACQALATAVWDSSLTATWSGSRFASGIKQRFNGETSVQRQTDTLRDFYDKAVLVPALKAYIAKPQEAGYSRNGTIHHASLTQFNEVNAVKALTVATGVVALHVRAT